MLNAFMVSIQVRDVPESVRDTLAEVARSRGQSMQSYLRHVLEDDARRATNVTLIERLRSSGGGYAGAEGEASSEIDAARNDRDRRTAGSE